MGRNRTPTAIMDAKGIFIANPRYARPDEPSTEGSRPLGPPPKWLSKEEKAVWKDLANQMLPGVVFFRSTLRAEVALKTLLFAQRSYSYSTEYHLQS